MGRHAARLLETARRRAGCSVPELAARLGRSNVGKFAARWNRRAHDGDLIDTSASALGVSSEALALARDLDEREGAKAFAEQARTARTHIIVRLMPAVQRRLDLPSGITATDAERAAADAARNHAKRVVLVLPTRSVHLDARGRVTAVHEQGPGESGPCVSGLRLD